MRVASCTSYGLPPAIKIVDVPDPVPESDQVVVDVAAAAVNFPDVLLVQDKYQWHVDVPFVPGSEFAGTVCRVGLGVRELQPGDRVRGSSLVGAFAERVAVAARSVERLAPEVDLRSAAAFGVVYRTAYHALRSVAAVKEDDWVVVLGAAGGVGLASIDVAKHLGARVVAAASTDEKLALCQARGADALINYSSEDLKSRIREITGPGADVVVDPVGGDLSEQALRATRFAGRYVCVGFAAGTIPRIPLNLVLLKGMIVTGFTMEGFGANRPDDLARDERELRALLDTGRLQPYISASYPLEETATALEELAERRAVGKVLVEPGATQS